MDNSELESYIYRIYPNGQMNLNGELVPDINALEEILFPLLNVESGVSFEQNSELPHAVDDNRRFVRYQQYFHSLRVIGGGITAGFIFTDGPTEAPCDQLFSLTPYILDQLSGFNTIPQIHKNALFQILNTSKIYASELVISHNLDLSCGYDLTWKVWYADNEMTYRIAIVNALDGAILDDFSGTSSLLGDTDYYGTALQLNDDTELNGFTFLRSSTADNVVKIHDFVGFSPCDAHEARFIDATVPRTSNAFLWNPNEFETDLTHCFYVTEQVKDVLLDVDIKFKEIHVGAGCGSFNASSFSGLTPTNEAFISVGSFDLMSLGTYDIIAHELGHSYLFMQGISSRTRSTGSLHEGIGDIFGVYVESKINGLDWKMGDDHPTLFDERIKIGDERDLENPRFSCFDDVSGAGRHDRALPLGHWFYLLTSGSNDLGIIGLGIDKSFEIVTSVIPHLTSGDDYADMMQISLNYVLDEYGRCSDEFITTAEAWEAICLETGYDDAAPGINVEDCVCGVYFQSGSNCEENENLRLCAIGYAPESSYQWAILSSQGAEYESVHGMQGRVQYGSSCLDLIEFPDFDSYPQYLEVELYTSFPSGGCVAYYRMKILDCDGDDPGCGSASSRLSENHKSDDIIDEEGVPLRGDYHTILYDLTGRAIMSGTLADIKQNLESTELQQILIKVVFGDNNEPLLIEKIYSQTP